MATQITEYKCPACTGPLHFDGASGKLVCDYCGSCYDVAEIEAMYAQQDTAAAEAFAEKEQQSDAPEGQWDMSGLTDDWGEDAKGMRVYNCPSCGAELITDETTAAASCPYCGNNTIVPGQLSGALKPDFVIPFKLDKEAAKAALKKHYGKRFLLPRVFSSENHIDEVKGIYVPFWLFDADVSADCDFTATRSHSHREGDYRVTVTDHFRVRRAGTMSFSRVPADGSKKMPDDYMESIEPFDYSELKPFSTAYLPGYLADKYDISAADCKKRADDRCGSSAKSILYRDVKGYETVVPAGSSIRLLKGKVHYALMPVWTLHTKWRDKDYLFMMNGQTGKMVGDLPIDKRKYWGLFAAVAAVGCGLFLLTGIGQAIASIFVG